jgi:tetratricopeptide (TPR) repeat protein
MMNTETRIPSILPALAVAILIPVLLRLLLPFAEWERSWGIDMSGDVSAWLSYVLLLLPLLSLLLLTSRGRDLCERLNERHGSIAAAALLFTLLIVSFFLPMDSFFYGDGGSLIPQIHLYSMGASYDSALLLNLKSSPLSGILLLAFMKWTPEVTTFLGLSWPVTAFYPFTLLSLTSLLGVSLYIFAVLPRRERLFAALLVTGTAGSLLFFGYVEYYAPVFAALLIFFLEGERVAAGRGSVKLLLAIFVLAVASHYLALALLPPLLYALATRRPGQGMVAKLLRHPFRLTLLSLLLFVIVYTIWALAGSDSRILMPLSAVHTEAGSLTYTLLSAAHLSDLLNLLLLLAPVALLLLLLLLLPHYRRQGVSQSGLHFALLSTIFLAAFIFFANTSFGLARDWDIAAPLGGALLLSALLSLRPFGAGAMTALGAASLLLTLPWIAVNTHSDSAAGRFERVLRLDDERMYGDYALSGYEALRKFHRNKGNTDSEIPITKRMIELADYPMHYRELLDAMAAFHRDDADTYDGLQRWILARLSDNAASLRARGIDESYSIGLKQIDSLAQGAAVQALVLQMPWPAFEFARIADITRDGRSWPAVDGLHAYARGGYVEAVEAFELALQGDFHNPVLYLFSGNALALSGHHVAALQRLEHGIDRFPDDGMLRLTLAKYYLRAGIQIDRASELLLWCAEYGQPTGREQEVADLLHSIAERAQVER